MSGTRCFAVDSPREAHSRNHQPLYVTSNGETAAVVWSPKAYDELADKAELAESIAMIDRSMEDISVSRTREAKPALQKLAQELGLKLDR